jgi:sulfide dehydrogenase cytochrome subunit
VLIAEQEEWMNGRRLVVLLCSLCPALALGVDDLTGRSIGSACFGCHGAAGANETSIPPVIVGVPEDYIVTAMKAFRDDSRQSTIMGRIAKGYTDAEIQAVARYIAGLGGE